MTKLAMLSAVAALTTAPALAATPAAPATAAAPAAAGINGIAVVSIDAVIANSNAFKAAQTARQTTYKPQIDQAQARAQQIEAQLKPLADKFQKDRAAGASQATLASEAETIQRIRTDGSQEINRILQPAQLSEAYGNEQIQGKLGDAVKTAMQKAGVSLLLRREAVIYGSPAVDLSQQVLTELNTLVPSVQIVPPAGWVPEDQRQPSAPATSRGTGDTSGR